jgi:hypothetical protein
MAKTKKVSPRHSSITGFCISCKKPVILINPQWGMAMRYKSECVMQINCGIQDSWIETNSMRWETGKWNMKRPTSRIQSRGAVNVQVEVPGLRRSRRGGRSWAPSPGRRWGGRRARGAAASCRRRPAGRWQRCTWQANRYQLVGREEWRSMAGQRGQRERETTEMRWSVLLVAVELPPVPMLVADHDEERQQGERPRPGAQRGPRPVQQVLGPPSPQ